jgi:hypothetical protein
MEGSMSTIATSTMRRPRPMYSPRFLERYGRTLQRPEIRLVQGFRGLAPTTQDALLRLVGGLVVDAARRRRGR